MCRFCGFGNYINIECPAGMNNRVLSTACAAYTTYTETDGHGSGISGENAVLYIPSRPIRSVEECCIVCHNTPSCAGFVKHEEYCYLKTSPLGAYNNTGRTLYALASPPAPAQSCFLDMITSTCASASEPCYQDNTCVTGGLGCNAGGYTLCRFCGFGAYIDCPSTIVTIPTYSVTLQFTIDVGHPSSGTETLSSQMWAIAIATALGIPASSVYIISVVAGSLQIDFTILPTLPTAATNESRLSNQGFLEIEDLELVASRVQTMSMLGGVQVVNSMKVVPPDRTQTTLAAPNTTSRSPTLDLPNQTTLSAPNTTSGPPTLANEKNALQDAPASEPFNQWILVSLGVCGSLLFVCLLVLCLCRAFDKKAASNKTKGRVSTSVNHRPSQPTGRPPPLRLAPLILPSQTPPIFLSTQYTERSTNTLFAEATKLAIDPSVQLRNAKRVTDTSEKHKELRSQTDRPAWQSARSKQRAQVSTHTRPCVRSDRVESHSRWRSSFLEDDNKDDNRTACSLGVPVRETFAGPSSRTSSSEEPIFLALSSQEGLESKLSRATEVRCAKIITEADWQESHTFMPLANRTGHGKTLRVQAAIDTKLHVFI